MGFLLMLAAWIGNLFIVLGLWGIGNKRRGAFVLGVIGESCYIWRSYVLHDWALMAVCGVFLMMAGRSWALWSADAVRWAWNAGIDRAEDYVVVRFDTDTARSGQPARSMGRVELRLEHRVFQTLRKEIAFAHVPTPALRRDGGRRARDIANALQEYLTSADGFAVELGLTEIQKRTWVEHDYNGTATISMLINGGCRMDKATD